MCQEIVWHFKNVSNIHCTYIRILNWPNAFVTLFRYGRNSCHESSNDYSIQLNFNSESL